MREILFRGKCVDDGEWIYGYLLESYSMKWIINPLSDGNFKWFLVDENTICQYTGLTDKNGNKIWENDVFRVITKDNYTGKVIFENGIFRVKWLTDDLLRTDLFFWTNKRAIEVISNVFDNKELLEE